MNNKSMRVSTIGSSQTVADELFRVVALYFGHKVEMQNKYYIKKMPDSLDDDLYIVLLTRVEEASKYVAKDKIFPLELVPEELFYKAMSEALHRVTKISERLSNEFAGFSF